MSYKKNLLIICYLYTYSSIRLLIICKHRDSNEFGNHFCILSAGMVQSSESTWTVLNIQSIYSIAFMTHHYKKE